MLDIFNYVDDTEVEIIEPVFNHYEKSDAHRVKISASSNNAGSNNGMFGKKHSEETRAKMSKANKLYDNSGSRNSMFGKTHSAEACAKMSKARKGVSTDGSVYHTPYGIFTSSQLAADAEGITRGTTIRYRCKSKNFPNYFQKSVK